MIPVFARTVLYIAAFLVAGSLLMLLMVRSGSSEQVITLMTLGLGLLLGTLAIVLVRRSRRQTPHKEDQ